MMNVVEVAEVTSIDAIADLARSASVYPEAFGCSSLLVCGNLAEGDEMKKSERAKRVWCLFVAHVKANMHAMFNMESVYTESDSTSGVERTTFIGTSTGSIHAGTIRVTRKFFGEPKYAPMISDRTDINNEVR